MVELERYCFWQYQEINVLIEQMFKGIIKKTLDEFIDLVQKTNKNMFELLKLISLEFKDFPNIKRGSDRKL